MAGNLLNANRNSGDFDFDTSQNSMVKTDGVIQNSTKQHKKTNFLQAERLRCDSLSFKSLHKVGMSIITVPLLILSIQMPPRAVVDCWQIAVVSDNSLLKY